MVGKQWLKSLPVALSLHGTYDSKRCYVVALPKTLLIAAIFVTFMNSKPLSRPVARFFGNGLLSYLRPRIQSICVNLYPTNPAAVDDNLCDTIERDSVDPGGIAVMVSGTKLPPPRSMNEMLEADYGSAPKNSPVPEASFGGPVLVATGVLDPLNDAKGRSEGLAALRDGIEFDPINAGHCPHDELEKDVAASIAKWLTTTVKPMKAPSKAGATSSVGL